MKSRENIGSIHSCFEVSGRFVVVIQTYSNTDGYKSNTLSDKANPPFK
jgi:hypothetical protein